MTAQVTPCVIMLALLQAYTIKDDFCGHSLHCNTSATEDAAVTAKITQFRDHPAVLMWYTNDELGLDFLPQLQVQRSETELRLHQHSMSNRQ